MLEPVALEIITAGRTGPNRSVRFGGDLSVDERGRRDISRLASTLSPSTTLCGPDAASRESASLLGEFDVDDGLTTLDVGSWAGRSPEAIDLAELGEWFGDPSSSPHGGESVVEFVGRIHRWRAGLGVSVSGVSVFGASVFAGSLRVVVAMPVAQALLTPDAAGFFGVDVRPATRYAC